MIGKLLGYISLILSLSALSGAVDFNRDIRPILSDKCFACHGFDEHDRKADLRLDTQEGSRKDLGGYVAIKPGDLRNSEAWIRISSEDEDEIMPPPKFHKTLNPAEKELIRQWISEGAEYQTHWAYTPLQKKVLTLGERLIDHYVTEGLTRNGFKLSASSDRITLVRRLYFDLLGLPPSTEAVERFVTDESPSAYESLVDKLLANPAFGERMAVYWLDLVRYADTIGYHSDNFMEVSSYRDYVISAFNRNLPFDQFTIEQLAGDLLPNPSLQQKIASGYNLLLQTTEEGGAQAEEYIVIHSADRVRNVSGVWLGSTIGCAQCHDHKYDPFTSRDFYTFAAFFADLKEKPIGKREPNLSLPTNEERDKIAHLERRIKETMLEAALARDSTLKNKVELERQIWETETQAIFSNESSDEWKIKKPNSMQTSGGQVLKVLADDSILTSGPNPPKDNYKFIIENSGKVSAIRLEALMDDSFPGKRLSRSNGNFILSEMFISHLGNKVKVVNALTDYEQKDWPVSAAIDGKDETGWAVDGHTDKAANRQAVFVFEQPLDLGEKGQLTIELRHQSNYAGHNIGRLRISVTDSLTPSIKGILAMPADVIVALKVPVEQRTVLQKTKLIDYFHSISPLLAPLVGENKKLKADLEALNRSVKTMLVSESLREPRITRILNRGDWMDKKGEIVQPALPAFLPRARELPADRRGSRLDLARWIVEPDNPLTSRTFVNRIWMLFFGSGLSRNVDDLGGQGEPPTHPELLDQLAVGFRDHGWNVKGLIKEILMSDTYRQASTVSPELLKVDPTNLLWGRQGRWRLDSEFIRDTALQLGALLVMQEGGKSVKPYQPAGYWQHLNFPPREWENGKNSDLYRRGLYTFRCRSFPHPAMVSFDAPSREECCSQRSRSNIPQQALVLMNDPSYVEAARKFADRVLKVPGDEKAKIQFVWKEATSRAANEEEVTILSELYQTQKLAYSKLEEEAKKLLSVGDAPSDGLQSPGEAAAWTQVTRAILNCYETTSRN